MGAESAEYWVTVGVQHLQHTTSSIMWALKVPNLRYRHKQNRCNICSHSLPQEIYATSTTLICISRIVTPRALCGRGAIDVKPLQGFFRNSASNKHPRHNAITPSHSHKESCQPSHTRNHANSVTQGITSKTSHFFSPTSATTAHVGNPVQMREYNVGDVA